MMLTKVCLVSFGMKLPWLHGSLLKSLRSTNFQSCALKQCQGFKDVKRFSTLHMVRCTLQNPKSVPQTHFRNFKTTCNYLAKDKLPYEVNSNVANNTLLYSYKNSRFYSILTIFGFVQFVFWNYLGAFTFRELKDMPKEEEDKLLGIERVSKDKWYMKLVSSEGIYKNGISFLCFSIAYIVFFITWMYPLRAVHKLWLLKGGNSVGVTTHAWFGKTRSFIVPVHRITCLQSRTGSATQIPMKIKGRWFFFLLDKKGTFHHNKLFDYTVGLKRSLK